MIAAVKRRGSLRRLTSMGQLAALGALTLWAFSCASTVSRPQATISTHPLALPLDALAHATEIQFALTTVMFCVTLGWSAWRTVSSSRALASLRQTVPHELALAANGLVPRSQLVVVAEESPYAACVGLFRPKIYVSAGLVELLPAEALRAALAHEEAHRRRRDPLRLLLAHLFARRLSAIPFARVLTSHIELRAELRADAFARAETSTQAIATALLCLLRAGVQGESTPLDVWVTKDVATSPLDGPRRAGSDLLLTRGHQRSHLEVRIEQLLRPAGGLPSPPLLPPNTSRAAAVSACLPALARALRGVGIISGIILVAQSASLPFLHSMQATIACLG